MQLDDYKKKVVAMTDGLKKLKNISVELNMNNSSERLSSITERLGEEVFRLVITHKVPLVVILAMG